MMTCSFLATLEFGVIFAGTRVRILVEGFFGRFYVVFFLLLSRHIGVLSLHLRHHQGAQLLELSDLFHCHLVSNLDGLHAAF